MIRDRLVVGIQDAALSQQLQLDPELTLEKAKMRIRQREAVGQQQKAVKAPPIANVADIEQLHSRRRLTQSNKGHRRATQNRGDRSGKPKDIRREWIRLIVQTRHCMVQRLQPSLRMPTKLSRVSKSYLQQKLSMDHLDSYSTALDSFKGNSVTKAKQQHNQCLSSKG